jgi:hypothetical protein
MNKYFLSTLCLSTTFFTCSAFSGDAEITSPDTHACMSTAVDEVNDNSEPLVPVGVASAAVAVVAAVPDHAEAFDDTTVSSDTTGSAAFFERDADFELKALDYYVRRAIQKMKEADYPSLIAGELDSLSSEHQTPRQSQYVLEMMTALLKHKNNDIMNAGAHWAERSLDDDHLQGMKAEVHEITSLLIDLLDSGNGLEGQLTRDAALKALFVIAQHFPHEQPRAMDAFLERAENDESFWVKCTINRCISDLALPLNYYEVEKALEKLSEDENDYVAEQAKEALLELAAKKPEDKPPIGIKIRPIPNGLRP